MKRISLVISFLLLSFIPVFSQSSKWSTMEELPDDALKSDILLIIGFYGNETAQAKNATVESIKSKILELGFNVKYVYIQTTISTPKEGEEIINKYKPKYIISFISMSQGSSGAFGIPNKLGVQRSYMGGANPLKWLSGLEKDVQKLKAKVSNADDNFSPSQIAIDSDSTKTNSSASTTTNEVDTNVKKFEKVKVIDGPPQDLKNNKLAVILGNTDALDDSIINALGSKMAGRINKSYENQDKLNAKIIENMKEYPYSYEMVNYDEFLKNKEKYTYILMLNKRSEWRDEYDAGSKSYKRKLVTIYEVYIMNPSDTTIRYEHKKWESQYFMPDAYKKFVKNILKQDD